MSFKSWSDKAIPKNDDKADDKPIATPPHKDAATSANSNTPKSK
ncbi:MAG: hypothetical protein ACKVGZ_10725 [Alphaproteobacteria bacterium]|jgi:hypothetical protein